MVTSTSYSKALHNLKLQFKTQEKNTYTYTNLPYCGRLAIELLMAMDFPKQKVHNLNCLRITLLYYIYIRPVFLINIIQANYNAPKTLAT